jgi:hypothetical protein
VVGRILGAGLKTPVASLNRAGCRAATVWRRSPRLTSTGISGKESYAT